MKIALSKGYAKVIVKPSQFLTHGAWLATASCLHHAVMTQQLLYQGRTHMPWMMLYLVRGLLALKRNGVHTFSSCKAQRRRGLSKKSPLMPSFYTHTCKHSHS